MSLDLFQQEANERLTALPPVQNVDPGMFDGFIRGTGMATMKGFAKAGRAIDLLGSIGPIVQDAFTGGTEAQDKYFAEHDAIYGRAVDYWTPRSSEIGSAAEVMGNLLSVIPQVIISPSLAVGTTQLGTAEDLVNAGVTSGKANVVGAIQGAGLGVGIWMPILGQNLWQRALIGGAGFNMAQGVVTRAASGVILNDTPAKDMFKAFDAEALTLDALLGMAFGSLAHLSPQQRAQGKEVWGRIQTWAQNLSPSEKAAIATLREGEHLNVDSTPGKPVGVPDIEAHVLRMRAAIDQLAKDQPVAVEDITVPRRPPEEVPEIQQLREELSDATTSRQAALDAGDQDAASRWNGEIDRINRELTQKTTEAAAAEARQSIAEQPRFEPDAERLREAESTMQTMVAEAAVVRAEEGLPPPPEEPPRVTQSVRRTIEQELANAGRPAEEAAAGAAIWDAFYTTMAKRIGTTAERLWEQFPLSRIINEPPPEQALKQAMKDVVETPEFKKWFGDSKVVDDSGRPLVVYHGTNADVEAFNRDALGSATKAKSSELGFYFTDSTEVARTFAIGEGGNVIPVMLRITNPIEIGFRTQAERKRAQPGQDPFDELQRAIAKIAGKESWKDVTTADVVAWKDHIESKGYDGVILRNTSMDAMPRSIAEPYHDFYIALRPEQIKSAIGNRGTFDPKNPNILFQDKRDTWYTSALGEGIAKLPMKSGTAKAWLDALKGLVSKGVKADEIKWSGIEEWLKLQDGKVTKEQVQEFLTNNGVKVEGGLPLFQKTKGAERGYMSMGEEGRVIGLLKNADASTFVHESGHFFLDTMAEIGKLPDVPVEVRADLDTALKWAGVKDPAKWPEMSLDEKRPYHEKFASGFEQYLRDGEAPSPELKGVFQRFRDWLVDIYKSAKSLNVKLNDDIRGVLNRMLADQARNPSTEAPLAPAGRVVSPPPLGGAGEAPAGAEVSPIQRPEVRTILQGMADNETGWAQIGGKLMDVTELGTGKPSFTTWIPKAEWWRDRPDKKMNGPQAQTAVRKALAGEKLKPIEQRIVDHMLQMADERTRGIDRVGGEEEYQALGSDAWDEGLEPTTENVVDLDLVARAAAIDEARVERAAMQYENDDAAFRGELEMLIHEHDTEQAAEIAGRSKAGEQQAPGQKPAAGEKAAPADLVRNEADLIVDKNPDMPITVGTNPDGTPMTMSAREYLDQARAEADLNRQDIPLLEVAAQCLLGKF